MQPVLYFKYMCYVHAISPVSRLTEKKCCSGENCNKTVYVDDNSEIAFVANGTEVTLIIHGLEVQNCEPWSVG